MQKSFFLFKQKTAYEMRISDWSSDVCSSDLAPAAQSLPGGSAPGMRVRVLHHARWRNPPDSSAHTGLHRHALACAGLLRDRKSVVSGKSVSVRVDLGCRRIIKKDTYPLFENNRRIHTKQLINNTQHEQ